MAMTSNFTTGWKLSGGFIEPFQLRHPMSVYEALAERGLAHSAPVGMELLNDAWIWLTAWHYQYTFSAPDEDDERYELCFEHLDGSGEILLNGRTVASFASGGMRLDITPYLEKENTLTVHFHSLLPDHLFDEHRIGILGPVRLRATNYITVHSAYFEAMPKVNDFAIQTSLSYTAHCAGRYVFRYIVSHGGRHIAQYDFPESLRAITGEARHTLSLAPEVSIEENSVLDVRLSIERAGIGCELIRMQILTGKGNGGACAANAAEFLYEDASESAERRIALLKDLGIERVYLTGANARMPEPNLSGAGIRVSPLDVGAIAVGCPAPVESSSIAALAGKEPSWPPSMPIWRLMGMDLEQYAALEALYGPELFSDMGLFVRTLRTRQAEELCRLIHDAHKNGRVAYLPMLMEHYPRLMSHALVECDGKPRPAFLAVRNLMSSAHAFVDLPRNGFVRMGALAKLAVWFDGTAGIRTPLSVSVACYDLSGHIMGGTSFTAYADKTVYLGDVTVDVPNKPCALILRTLTAGFDHKASAVNDQILLAGNGDAPLSPLLHLPETTLCAEAGRLVNTGSSAALSLAVYGDMFAYYGALLPEDHVPISVKHPLRVESLNGQYS